MPQKRREALRATPQAAILSDVCRSWIPLAFAMWFTLRMEFLSSLIDHVRAACVDFPDERRGDVRYSMADIGLSAFSLVLHAE